MIWYEEEVKQLEQEKTTWQFNPSTVFYGSSSIRLWDTLAIDFKGYAAANLGFGGSTLAACVQYFDRLFADITPNTIIIYAGDNDLGDGTEPDGVLYLFKELVSKIHARYGQVTIGFISIKPSISRFHIIEKIKKANSLIKEEIGRLGATLCFIDLFADMLDENGKPDPRYYEEDGLHINNEGYYLWKKRIYDYIASGELKI